MIKIFAFGILFLFYSVYIGKIFMQKRKGIITDHIAKSQIHNKEFYIEVVMKIATYSIVLVEILSIIFGYSLLPIWLQIIGCVIGYMGDFIFANAVWTMRDSWRAGLAREDKTEMVTRGIYQISRNPAFLGFDFMYIGICLCFFNPILLVFTIWAITMLHLQIRQEEKYLAEVFGQEYQNYKAKTKRYLGWKLTK